MRMWFGRKRRFQKRFRKNDFLESSEPLENPGCGWYHVYSFVIGRTPGDSFEDTIGSLAVASKKEQLVLARIDIGAFRACEISGEALLYIEQILKLFRSYKKQIILRFSYDIAGKGMEREPMELSLIMKHMEQLGCIICKYAEDILVLQGIFVGNWGEMHGSKFLDTENMTKLLLSLHEAVKKSCYLAVRTPAKWREIMSNPKAVQDLSGRVALFNDGLFGSSTDLGTYKENGSFLSRGSGPMGRREELEWQSLHMENLPNGGEALAGEELTGYFQAVKEMQKLHLSYLNSVWQKEQLEYWKKETVKDSGCWNGLSGYEYIGRHLGYRFVIRDVKAVSEEQLRVVVENCGFAGLCEEAGCFLLIERNDEIVSYELLYIDARRWASGKKTQFFISLPGMEEMKGSRVYLRLQRKRDGRMIYFANQNTGDKVLLGEFTE